jgi:hypothetical protein
MEKIVVNFSKQEKSTFDFDGQTIEVAPYIPGSLGGFLIDQYVKEYFYSATDQKILPDLLRNYLGAQLHLKLTILDRLTNIQISNENDPNYTDFICVALWDSVVQEIKNYWEFSESLSCVVDEIKEEIKIEKSVGGVIGGVASKINELLEKLNSISPEEMKGMAETASKTLKELETSKAASLFVEAGKNKASKVQ